MATELTTSKNALGGKKTEKLPEMTAEQKAAQKEADIKILEEYCIQIDQDKLEIVRLETALEKDLPRREVILQLRQLKDRLQQFKKFKELVEGRRE